MRYAVGLFLGTVLLAASAQAAGPFDGSWTGEAPMVRMGGGKGCPAATFTATVTNGKMEGHYADGKYTFKFTGTVGPDGTLAGGMLGTNPVTGKFTQSDFSGNYTSTGCEGQARQISMHRG